MLSRVCQLVGGIWRHVRLTWRMIYLCRFSAIVVVVFGLAFIFIDQIQDLLMALDDAGKHWPQWLFLYVAIWAAAISSWYWARILLSFDFPGTPALDEFIRGVNTHLPRVLGVLMFAFVVVAIGRAAWALRFEVDSLLTLIVGAALLAVQGALFFAFVIYRRDWLRKLDKRLERSGGDRAIPRLLRAAIKIYDAPEKKRFKNFRDLGPNTIVALGLSLLTSLALFLIVLRYPVGPAIRFGAGAVVLTAAANLIPVGSLFVYWSNRCQLPFLSAVIAWAVVASFFNDNHDVRSLPKDAVGTASPDSRLALDKAYERWRDHFGASSARPLRPVIVATAGGGSRAAYWTALVLGTIQDQCPAFGDRLFGISGVSGGSLGAAIFVGLLADQGAGGPQPCSPPPDGGRHFAEAGGAVASMDFLSPTLAGLLYPDLAQRFLVPGFLPDRAEYLELSWEAAWHAAAESSATAFPSTDSFAAPFAALWPGDGGDWRKKARIWPALFLNGTNVETGKRIIASNLLIDARFFRDAYDAFRVAGADLAVSTAVNMSTRFPYAEAAGTLRHPQDGPRWGHIVDGGYFENFGAATAAEILEAIASSGGTDVRPIVIQISSDPDFDGLHANGEILDPNETSFGRELYAPIRTFFNTRTARGSLAAEMLRDRVQRLAGGGDFLHFRLCRIAGHTAPALGWTLSHAARQEIDAMLDHVDSAQECDNPAEFKRLLQLLRE